MQLCPYVQNEIIQKPPDLQGKKRMEYLTIQFCHKFRCILKCPVVEVQLFLNFRNKRSIRKERDLTACPPLSSPQVNQIKEDECQQARLASFLSLQGQRKGWGRKGCGHSSVNQCPTIEKGPAQGPRSWREIRPIRRRSTPERKASSQAGRGKGNCTHKYYEGALISVLGEGWRKEKQKRTRRRGSRPSGF